MIRTVDDVIEAIGGTSAAAGICGTVKSTVSSWRARSAIPADKWQSILDEARRLGRNEVTAEALARIHAKRPEGAEARP